MTAIVSAFLALLFLGFPFYWGTLGHHGFILPLAWAVLVALLMSVRRWENMERHVVMSFAFTLIVSILACTMAFEVGRVLSR